MNELVTKNQAGEFIITSLRIAEIFDKEHYNVLRLIRKYLKDVKENCIENKAVRIEATVYIDKNGDKKPMFELSEQEALIVTGRFAGSKAIAHQRKIAAQFLAMRDYIRAQESAKGQLTHDDRRMLAITKINPNTLKAITGERNNRKVKVSYDALVEYGLFGVNSSFVEKRTYFVKPLGYEFISGFTHNTPHFTPEKHAELTRIIEQFMITQSRGQTDVFIQ